MDYFNNIIEIIKPLGTITQISKNEVIIDNKGIILAYVVTDKEIEIKSTDCLSFHMLRIIVNKLKFYKTTWILDKIYIENEKLLDYFIGFNKIIETNIYDYCTICGVIHDKLGLNYITTCTKPKCIKKYYHYPSEKIINCYKQDSKTVLLLFELILSVFSHPKVEKILSFLPIIYGYNTIEVLKIQIQKELTKNNFTSIIEMFSSSENDFILWKRMSAFMFALITNALFNNYYSLCSYNDLSIGNLKKQLIKNCDDIEYFNISYSTDIETKIKSQLDNDYKYYYLYHGSPFYCWYSIIKNGLKVMSGTEFMTTGAAYGNGIYASDQLAISHGYAKPVLSSTSVIIGLFQIIKNPLEYKQTTGIYVIPDSSILVLRTLIKIKNGTNLYESYTHLDNYFIIQQANEKKKNDTYLTTLTNKRLIAELKLINTETHKFKVIEYHNNNDKPWLIELYVNNNTYILELSFFDYPMNPPLFVVKNLKIDDIKGIIDDKFKICLPILDPHVWNITNKLVNIIDSIHTFFIMNY
jgi:hypothetical protein